MASDQIPLPLPPPEPSEVRKVRREILSFNWSNEFILAMGELGCAFLSPLGQGAISTHRQQEIFKSFEFTELPKLDPQLVDRYDPSYRERHGVRSPADLWAMLLGPRGQISKWKKKKKGLYALGARVKQLDGAHRHNFRCVREWQLFPDLDWEHGHNTPATALHNGLPTLTLDVDPGDTLEDELTTTIDRFDTPVDMDVCTVGKEIAETIVVGYMAKALLSAIGNLG